MKTSVILLATALTANSLYAHDDQEFSHRHSLDPVKNESEIDNSQNPREIQTETLSRLVRAANPTVMIVDARDLKTDDGKRIPGAKAIPFDATIVNITANLPDKQAMIIVYCSNTRCPKGGLLADRLVRMGYKNVWNYPGGIEEWEKSGQKIEKGKTAAQSAAELGPKSA